MSASRLDITKLLYLKNSRMLNENTSETDKAMRRSVRFLLDSMNCATHQSNTDVPTSSRKNNPLHL